MLFVERGGRGLMATTVAAVTGVAHDSEEPGSRITAGKRPKVSKRPERRLLDRVFRVVFVANQPARQPLSGAEVGQHDLVEAGTDSRRRCPPIESATHRAL